MSELKSEFERIPKSGIKVNTSQLKYQGVSELVKAKALEYGGILAFSRINELRSAGRYNESEKVAILELANREVARFSVEYGLASLAIHNLYKNPLVVFTEPSGYIRGYFYNSYLSPEKNLPVIYLC